MSKNIKLGCILVLVVLVLAGGAAIYYLTQNPDTAQKLPPKIIVTLIKPLDTSTWAVFTPIPISAQASSSKPIKSFELWADGALVESKVAAYGAASWTWKVEREGEHSLYVRALDADGNMANSNVVRVKAAGAPPGMIVMQPAKPGDTVESLAANFKIPPQKIIDLNPALNPNTSIPPGQTVKVPIPPVLPPAPPPNEPDNPIGPTQPPTSFSPSLFPLWLGKILNPKSPAAPDLQLKTIQCSVNFFVSDKSDNEDGFYIYRLDPNEKSFKRIRTLGANQNAALPIQSVDADLYGNFNYYASAFNAAGESQSKILGASIASANCQSPYWAGLKLIPGGVNLPKLSIIPTFLPPGFGETIPDVPKVEKAYFYLSINSAQWTRVPTDSNAFITPKEGIFDADAEIKSHVPPPTQGELNLAIDAWGWQSGKLIHIGEFKRVLAAPKKDKPQIPEPYTPSTLEICNYYDSCSGSNDISQFVTAEQKSSEWTKWEFAWTPDPSNANEGRWQVAGQPFPNSCELDPPGILATSTVNAESGYITHFTIDFGLLKNIPVIVYGWKITPPRYYVRILPMANGQLICEPTNTVVLSVDTTPAPGVVLPTPPPAAPIPPVPFDVKIKEFTPIQFPDWDYRYCVVVKKNLYYEDPGAFESQYILSHFGASTQSPEYQVLVEEHKLWKPGTEICPQLYEYKEPSLLDEIVSGLKEALNFTAWLYNGFKNMLVTLVDELNPLCLASKSIAKEVDSGQGTVEEVCHAIAEYAVDAAFTYVGLPPSLPNYDELVEIGKGNATDVIAQEFEDQTGVPCGDTCKELIRKGIDASLDAVKESMSNHACMGKEQAHANGIEPLCFPFDVKTVPSPKGQLIPAIVKIEVTRKASVPESAFPDPNLFKTSCSLSIHVNGKNNSWIGQKVYLGEDSYGKHYWEGAPLSGKLYEPVGVNIQKMTPGQTKTITLALNAGKHDFTMPPAPFSNDGYFLPGRVEHLQNWVNDADRPSVSSMDDWRYLYFGATAKVSLNGSCATSAKGYTSSASTFGDEITTTIPKKEQ